MALDRTSRSTEQLLQELEQNSRGLKAGPFAELVARSSITPAGLKDRLIACGKPKRDRTASGRLTKGRHQCRLSCCSRCQEKAGMKAGIRTWSLVAAATDSKPNRNGISFVSINSENRDLAGFDHWIRTFMRRHPLKLSGVYSVSLNGALHVHAVVLHPGLGRLQLERVLKEEFGEYPVVNVKPLRITQEVEEAVRNVIQYAHMPVKKKDFERQPHLRSPESLAQFVEWDSEVDSARKLEAGFTLNEKSKAKQIRTRIRKFSKAERKRGQEFLEKLEQSRARREAEKLRQELGEECVERSKELGSTSGSVDPSLADAVTGSPLPSRISGASRSGRTGQRWAGAGGGTAGRRTCAGPV